VLAHGFDLTAAAFRDLARIAGLDPSVTTLLHADATVTLGDCLNRLVAAADGDLVAKMDDDDAYGPEYLADQVDALAYSGADLVGKQAHYVYLAGHDVTLLLNPRAERRWADFVAGPTIVTARDLASQVAFPPVGVGEDSAFLARVRAAGGRIYSADRFNFLRRRLGSGHTWPVADAEFLARGQVVAYGAAEGSVML